MTRQCHADCVTVVDVFQLLCILVGIVLLASFHSQQTTCITIDVVSALVTGSNVLHRRPINSWAGLAPTPAVGVPSLECSLAVPWTPTHQNHDSLLTVFTAFSAFPLDCGKCGDDVSCLNAHVFANTTNSAGANCGPLSLQTISGTPNRAYTSFFSRMTFLEHGNFDVVAVVFNDDNRLRPCSSHRSTPIFAHGRLETSCCMVGSLPGESWCARQMSHFDTYSLTSVDIRGQYSVSRIRRAHPSMSMCAEWATISSSLRFDTGTTNRCRLKITMSSSLESKYGRTHSGTSDLSSGHPCWMTLRKCCITGSFADANCSCRHRSSVTGSDDLWSTLTFLCYFTSDHLWQVDSGQRVCQEHRFSS